MTIVTKPKFNVNTDYVQTILHGLEQVQPTVTNQAGATAIELTAFLKKAKFEKTEASISSTLSRLYEYGHIDRIKDPSGGHKFLYSMRSRKHSSIRELNKRVVMSKEVKPAFDLDGFVELLEQHEKYKEVLTSIARMLKEIGIEG